MFVPFVAVDGAKRGKESVRTRERMHIALGANFMHFLHVATSSKIYV